MFWRSKGLILGNYRLLNNSNRLQSKTYQIQNYGSLKDIKSVYLKHNYGERFNRKNYRAKNQGAQDECF